MADCTTAAPCVVEFSEATLAAVALPLILVVLLLVAVLVRGLK